MGTSVHGNCRLPQKFTWWLLGYVSSLSAAVDASHTGSGLWVAVDGRASILYTRSWAHAWSPRSLEFETHLGPLRFASHIDINTETEAQFVTMVTAMESWCAANPTRTHTHWPSQRNCQDKTLFKRLRSHTWWWSSAFSPSISSYHSLTLLTYLSGLVFLELSL